MSDDSKNDRSIDRNPYVPGPCKYPNPAVEVSDDGVTVTIHAIDAKSFANFMKEKPPALGDYPKRKAP